MPQTETKRQEDIQKKQTNIDRHTNRQSEVRVKHRNTHTEKRIETDRKTDKETDRRIQT